MFMQLRVVQRNLSTRNVCCHFDGSFSDGRQKIAVYPRGKKYLAKFTDDVDEAYIFGLRGFGA